MKYFYITCLAWLLPLLGYAQAKAVPYSSEIGGDGALDAGWTVIDVNNDGKTWANDNYPQNRGYDVAGTSHGAIFTYHSSNQGNDLLITPAIHLEEGEEYKISFWVKTGSGTESMALLMSNGNQVSNFTNAVQLLDMPSLKISSAFERKTCTFVNRGEGDYYFAFKAYSAADQYFIYLTNFSIALNGTSPAAPSGLTAAVGDNDAITVDLAWTLPTLDDEGETLPASAITAVRVSRDGQVVATLPANATSWRDTETTGLTAGVHSYEVCAVAGNIVGVPAKVKTGYVGPIQAQTLPWNADLSSQEAIGNLWTIIKGPQSTQTKTWAYNYSSYSSYWGLSTLTGVEDEYLITPPLKVEHAGAYKVTFSWTAGYYQHEKLELLLGNGRNIDALSNVVTTFTSKSNSGSRQDYEASFEVTEPGTYYLALHACSDDIKSVQTYGNQYYIYSLAVESNNIVPAQVTDLTATPAADMSNNAVLAWTNPDKNNAGNALTELSKVDVMRAPVTGTGYGRKAGEFAIVKTFNVPTMGASMTYTDAVPQPGFYAYRVIASNANGAAEGEPLTVFTDWVGDKTQPLPYSTDFKDEATFNTFYTIVDANADGNSFEWTSGYQIRFNHNDTEADDYLISPTFDFTPGYYKVTLGYNGNTAHFKMGLVTDATQPANTFTEVKEIYIPSYGNFTDEVMIKVDQAGKYSVALHDISGAQVNYLQIKSLAVERTEVLPEVATELTAQVEGSDVTLTWRNPSQTNVTGMALESITKAVIVRNGEAVAEITEGLTPGETATYTDHVPAGGAYTYSVEIYNANGKSDKDAPSISLEWVGNGIELPFIANFGNNAEWTIVNANGDNQTYSDEYGDWTEEYTWATSNGKLYYGYNSRTADDWAMSPRLQFPEGKDVKVTITSSTASGHDVNWDVALAPAIDHTQMVTCATITTASSITEGDFTGDNSVDVSDVNALINAILGKSTQTTYAGSSMDLTGDGALDVSDVNALINAVLGKGSITGNLQQNVFIISGKAGMNIIGLHAKMAGDLSIHSLKVEEVK
ncbi:MAG: choice-of-anchor J domain-containing protein [Muribaculaceae bacterium]|nr:choice-of-anchor J domain-containing protein [Muribaculaceae bacterium]